MNSWMFTIVWMLERFCLWFWSFSPSERVGLSAAFLVLTGVVGEEIVELRFLDGKEKEFIKETVKKLSIGLLLVGLTGDVLGVVMGQAEMAALTQETGEAAKSAKTAHVEADAAHNLAQSASDIAIPAKETAEKANILAGEAQGEANAAASKADDLDRQLAATKTDLDSAKSQLAVAEAAEKKEEQALIDMAVCSAPRVVGMWIANGKTAIDPLLPMMGQKVFIEYVPDPEARRAANSLAEVLSDARWDVQRPLRVVDGLKDGVSVQASMAGLNLTWVGLASPEREAFNRSHDAHDKALDTVDKLVDFLHLYNWQADWGWPNDAQVRMIYDPSILPAGSIRVQIGLYPAVSYVVPPAEEPLAEATARFEKESQKRTEESEERARKRDEELLKRITPQEAAAVRAFKEWSKAEQERSEKRHFNPCRPLNRLTPNIEP